MAYEDYEEEYTEEEYEEEEEHEDEEDFEEEDEEIYDYVESVERQGNVFEIEIGAIDVCCTTKLRLTSSEAIDLIKEIAKKLNKEELKQVFAIL